MSRDLQQQRDNDNETKSAGEVDVDAEHKPEVSRKASNAGLRREVQMKAGSANADPAQVHEAAQEGIATGGAPVPHLDAIQRAFGNHDVRGVQAHVGGPAANATAAMGAQAYATGDRVAFRQQPDLHTAAHEVAHVVQQRNGVSLSGGVGAAGDSHEKQADKVADKVVAGESVEHMLGPAKAAGPAPASAVQMKPADKAADPKAAHEASDSASYGSVQSALLLYAKHLHEWGTEARDLANAPSVEGSGTSVQEGRINAIYERALNNAARIGDLLMTADKGLRYTLAPDVKKVLGGFSRFWQNMQRPVSFMKDKGYALDLQKIQSTINGYSQTIGLDSTAKLEPDTVKPEGDEKKMSKQMVDEQVTALETAMASVKAGNDADMSRVTMHLRYLDGIAKENPAEIKAHKPQLKKLLKEVDGLDVKARPELDKYNRQAEAHIHLKSILD